MTNEKGMTNEEAIEHIKDIICENNTLTPSIVIFKQEKEALYMALNALELQSCEDCISREEAIRIAEQGQIQGYLWQFQKLCTLPSVTPQTRWILCSERLPKTDEDVLVCNSQGTMEVCYYHIDDTYYPTEYANLNETGWYNENDDVLDFEPIAWMSLPQHPYNTESEE